MFQIPEGHILFDAVWSPEHFDTFFIEIGQKMRQCRPKKTKKKPENDWDKGGGSITIWVI